MGEHNNNSNHEFDHHHHNYHHQNENDDDRAENGDQCVDSSLSSSSSSMQITYSVNTESEYTFARSSANKAGKQLSQVQAIRLKFENADKVFAYRRKRQDLPEIPPKPNRKRELLQPVMSDEDRDGEVPSEDEVEDFGESEDVATEADGVNKNSIADDEDHHKEDEESSDKFPEEHQVPVIMVDDVNNEENDSSSYKVGGGDSSYLHDNGMKTLRSVSAGYRPFSEPLPEATNRHIIFKSFSHKGAKLKEKSSKLSNQKHESKSIESHECYITNELIATEQSYVDSLKRGVENYVRIYDNETTIPASLRGKKYFLFGNLEQLVELHENELLPMMEENRNDIAKLCERFYEVLMGNKFYGYVLYAINKSNSERICIEEKQYFKNIQDLAGDRLGIDSFLVQPIQRLPRYVLLFEELISKYFKSDVTKYKTEIGLCCKVEKHIRNLLQTVNEAMQLNDIQECHEINLFYQGCFKRCFDLTNYDYAVRRSYKCRLFIFERSVVYTEILKDKKLQYRGYYPRERIGIESRKKNFSLYYQRKKVQQCDFSGDSQKQDQCIELVKEMMQAYGKEEQEKVNEMYKKAGDVFRRPGPKLKIHPDSRASTDSGVGSVYSTISITSDDSAPRTTWYTESFLSPSV